VRAGAARRLVEYGQDPEMVGVESCGETEPPAPNETADGRAQNRRVEVFFARTDMIHAVKRWTLTGEEIPALTDAAGVGVTPGPELVDVVPDVAHTEGR
jgi:hypothetical protein